MGYTWRLGLEDNIQPGVDYTYMLKVTNNTQLGVDKLGLDVLSRDRSNSFYTRTSRVG